MQLTGEVRRVVDAIVTKVLAGTYPAGLRLPAESDLAVEHGCGRSTVREALRHLSDLGLVRSRRGSGAMVLDFHREGTPALLPAYVRAGASDVPPARLSIELLRIRTLMAAEAVRLAAQYASDGALEEARRAIAHAPSLEHDAVAHAENELVIYRAFVLASGMWPAAWLANAFWVPMRELHELFAPAVAAVQPGFQRYIERLLALVERREAEQAVALVRSWFESIDRRLTVLFEHTIERAATPEPTSARRPAASPTTADADRAVPTDPARTGT